ncbi:choice-of-anchor D domain-containing protein [Chloroflexota bacterium]
MTTDVYSFTIMEDDTTDPYTCCHDPADGDTDVPINTNIVLNVKDDGVGVNQSTIAMTVEGMAVTPTITGSPADYTLTYNPPSNSAYLQVVNVTVDASDLVGNSMTTDSYSFTTIPPPPPPPQDIQVIPPSINFGSVSVNSTSTSVIVTVSNEGNANLNIANVSVNNSQFNIISNILSGHVLTPGSSEQMSIVFSPVAIGQHTATMTITSNDPDENPVIVTLSGTGSESPPPPDDVPIDTEPPLWEPPSYIFTVDFLGEITTGPISERGKLLEDIVAMSLDGIHVI